jgi:trigger factor
MREEVNFKLEGKEWVELQNKAFEKLNKKANIDGFRPGKAPRDIFEKKYGKQEIVLEAADEATNKEYKRLLGENKITPIIEPKVELIKFITLIAPFTKALPLKSISSLID